MMVKRIWRRGGRKVFKKLPKRERLRLGDGTCIRLGPEHQNHVWSYDLMIDRIADGRISKILDIMNE
jgi:putative transposase